MKLFDRLIGLETEYAIRSRSRPDGGPTDHELFDRLVERLRQRLPTATAAIPGQNKPGVFLANGGAVWFERCRQADPSGLVEGCTPECRGPRQLIACQRAQDRLLAEAAGEEFQLVKNCRDSRGKSYGAQENYEAVVAKGWRLVVWRLGWLVVYPLAMGTFVLNSVVFTLPLLVNFVIGGLLCHLICAHGRVTPQRQAVWRRRLVGLQWFTGDTLDAPYPAWAEGPLLVMLKSMFFPLYLLLCGLMALTDLRRTQRRMLPFLISRAVIGGAGWLDGRGRFHVTEKAETRRFIWHELLPAESKPVFNFGHFVKLALIFPPRFRDMWRARQRLQISLGDSNLCEEAEYLRVATTLLVLDAIEAGTIDEVPAVLSAKSALRAVSRDATLTVAVRVRGGGSMTALELQRWYLEACRRFMAGREDAPEEAREVLRRWADVLDRLENDRDSLVGRLDWVTKLYLLNEAGDGLLRESRKKIDLRYHELSEWGYFARLRSAGQAVAVVSEREVEQVMRFPPPSSPAVRRARYIREFSGTNTLLKVSWRLIEVVRNGVVESRIDLREPRP